jgi:hypothetical protein
MVQIDGCAYAIGKLMREARANNKDRWLAFSENADGRSAVQLASDPHFGSKPCHRMLREKFIIRKRQEDNIKDRTMSLPEMCIEDRGKMAGPMAHLKELVLPHANGRKDADFHSSDSSEIDGKGDAKVPLERRRSAVPPMALVVMPRVRTDADNLKAEMTAFQVTDQSGGYEGYTRMTEYVESLRKLYTPERIGALDGEPSHFATPMTQLMKEDLYEAALLCQVCGCVCLSSRARDRRNHERDDAITQKRDNSMLEPVTREITCGRERTRRDLCMCSFSRSLASGTTQCPTHLLPPARARPALSLSLFLSLSLSLATSSAGSPSRTTPARGR